jgi:hypothetical protein
MAVYSAGFSVAGVNTANTVLLNLKTAASDRATLLEVGIFLSVLPTTTPDIVLARMTAVGTGAITTTANIAHDSGDAAAASTVETAWATTRPTFTTTGPFFRRGGIPLTLGNGLIWSFAQPIRLAVSTGLVLANVAASGATLGNFTGYLGWDE